MKKISLFALAAVLAAVSCKQKEEEKTLQYYATPNPYEIVDVTMPPVDNDRSRFFPVSLPANRVTPRAEMPFCL